MHNIFCIHGNLFDLNGNSRMSVFIRISDIELSACLNKLALNKSQQTAVCHVLRGLVVNQDDYIELNNLLSFIV